MVGELIVEGPMISSGYLNDPEKTNQVFITSPSWLAQVRPNSGRMYKTGDLVRQTSDGSLMFVGKKDDQEVVDNIVGPPPATERQTTDPHNLHSRYQWISLPKTVNQEHVLNACHQLVQKHSILRTVFCTNDDKLVVQLTLRKIPVSFVHYSNIKNLEKHCADDSLAMGAPIYGELGSQVQLLTLRNSRMFLILPHALFDGISLGTICDDLSSAYRGNLLPPCAQFSDHIRHVWNKRTPETYNVWKEVPGDVQMAVLDQKFLRYEDLPSDNENPLSKQPEGVTARAETSPISPPPNTTTATLRSRDVIFGQVIHGRGLGISHEDRIVGPCLNIIPVQVHSPQRANKFDLLDQVQQQHIQTMPVENFETDEIARNCTSWEAGTKFGSFVRLQNFTNIDKSTCSFDESVCETGLYSLPNRPSAAASVPVIPRGPMLTISMTISNEVLDQGSEDYVVEYFSGVIESLASGQTN
ncbi:putative NRPS-like protein biosynthetic cluster [Arachnomyces sp. PD_36]|nr:putative NRPS-like protein biosynthetic cluster [Arachnomyces sp. PD_36]